MQGEDGQVFVDRETPFPSLDAFIEHALSHGLYVAGQMVRLLPPPHTAVNGDRKRSSYIEYKRTSVKRGMQDEQKEDQPHGADSSVLLYADDNLEMPVAGEDSVFVFVFCFFFLEQGGYKGKSEREIDR